MQWLFRRKFVGLIASAIAGITIAVAYFLTSSYTVVAATLPAPTLAAPANGSTLSDFGPSLSWALPGGSTQYQLQVTPINNDGPGVNIIQNADTSFTIPAPPDWYGLLPDMTYTWQVRATDATTAASESDASWGPWSQGFTFRTPKVDIRTVTPFDPISGRVVAGDNPVLRWSSSSPDVFYWEAQVSKDPLFGSGAFLYWTIVHGDVTYPNNAYTIPSSFLLESGASYYWRVRPRVQGDGAPLAWTPAATFSTPALNKIFLQMSSPNDESVVNTSTVVVSGTTKAGAFVSVEEQLVTADAAGNFSVTVTLVEGINSIDILASDDTGDVANITFTITYTP